MEWNREKGEKQRKNSDIIAQGFSVYEVPPDGAHELWSEGGIRESTKEVCRNLIKSMPRRMEPMIKAKECQTMCKQKN